MKTTSDFDTFCEGELKHALLALENKRLAIVNRFSFRKYRRMLLFLLVLIVATMIAIALEFVPFLSILVLPASVLYAVLAPVYIYVRRSASFKSVNNEFKSTVIPKLIVFINPNLAYKPAEGIREDELAASRLFPENHHQFRSEDLVEGVVEGGTIRMSDVRWTYHRAYRDVNAKTTSTSSNSINGLLATFDLGLKVPADMIIKPGHVSGRGVLDHMPDGGGIDRVHLEKFDKQFNVECSDTGLVRQLLVPMVTQLLLAVKEELKVDLYVSVVENRLYVFYQGVFLFDSAHHWSFVEKNLPRQYFQYIAGILGLAQAVTGALKKG
ncbi:MAG: DUF3137 domain-containing protein [Cyclobacteriaceae bacterium]|nr:DUF3137 domain-containing protein [Cyclobacteriaceae bacterium]